MSIQKFKIILPAEISKAGKNGERRIRGLATTESLDRQGEVLKHSGVDLSPIDKGRGIINWEHGSGPEDQLGILDGYSREDNQIFLEGTLFKNHTRAKAAWEILESLEGSSKGRLGMSVQGQIVKRNDKNSKIVERCVIDSVALTLKPVNTDTHVSLVKSMTSAGSLEFSEPKKSSYSSEEVLSLLTKALGIGAGSVAAPDTRSGGDALVVESFGEKKKKRKPVDVTKAAFYEEGLEKVLDKLQVMYPQESRYILWSALKSRIQQS